MTTTTSTASTAADNNTSNNNTAASPSFEPQSDWTLISQGAEARLFLIPKYTSTLSAVAKQRFSKSYRHVLLDERLTKKRCKAEAKCLVKCRRAGIPCPAILAVHPPVLYMEHLQACTVRDYIEQQQKVDLQLAQDMGNIIGRMHNISVVHGDLTTSNMMVFQSKLYMIDFGLARISKNPEELAVDLYVLERALLSTHPKLEETTFLEQLLASYKATCTKSDAVLQRLAQVRLRGRKRECFG